MGSWKNELLQTLELSATDSLRVDGQRSARWRHQVYNLLFFVNTITDLLSLRKIQQINIFFAEQNKTPRQLHRASRAQGGQETAEQQVGARARA